jgi:hypothetical protein
MVHVIIVDVFETFRRFNTVDDGGSIVYPGERDDISVLGIFVLDESFVTGLDSADEKAEGEEVAMVHCLPGVSYDCATTY